MTFIQLILCLFVSFLITVIVMPKYIKYLRKVRFGQVEREEGLASHKQKGGTPTMGGLVFIIATVLAVYLCNVSLILDPFVNLLTLVILGFGFIGFIDDFLIVAKNNNDGLKPAQKYGLQSIMAVVFYLLAWKFLPNFSTAIMIPLTHYELNLGILYPVFVYFMFTAESNAVNLTDGLDGLATGLMIIALVPFMIFGIIQKNMIVAAYAASLIGGLLGFMIFNYHPARIFMGDCGSLALGAFLAALAVMTKQELLLIVIGIVPLTETLSVIIQVTSYKTRHKRVFKMSPIHHHFEMSGWSETNVVRRFWIVGLAAAVIGLLLGVI